MKKGIHPDYQPTVFRCACGAVIETRSTKQNVTVQVCSSCHPFFTGKQKLVDTAGRIERFQKRYAKKGAKKKSAEAALENTAENTAENTGENA